MTKEQRKDVLAKFVEGITPEAIAKALSLPLDEVQTAVNQVPSAVVAVPAEPDRSMTPERAARRADAAQHLARLAAERARIPTDLQRIEDRDRRSEGGVRIVGPDCAVIYTPDRRRL